MDQLNDYEKLDGIVVTHHKSGNPVVRLGGVGMLCPSHNDRARYLAAIDAAEEFRALFPDKVTAWQKATANRLSPIEGNEWRDYYARRSFGSDGFNAHYVDIRARDEITMHSFLVSRSFPEAPRPLAYGQWDITLPLPWLKANEDAFIDHMIRWCGMIRPEQGTFGIAPVASEGMYRKFCREIWPLTSRFSGFDAHHLFGLAAKESYAGIRAVNWLTVLDDIWVDRLGGQDVIEAGLHPEGSVYPYDGGIVIRACIHPQVGDLNGTGLPEAYVAVDALIRPHRFLDYRDTPMHLFNVPEPLDAYEATMSWLRRFEPEE